jgi:hypothetical protein
MVAMATITDTETLLFRFPRNRSTLISSEILAMTAKATRPRWSWVSRLAENRMTTKPRRETEAV